MKTPTHLQRTVEHIADEASTLFKAIKDARKVLAREHMRIACEPWTQRERLTQIMGMGVLLNDLQQCRMRMNDLSARLPSPNTLSDIHQEKAYDLGMQLLEAEETIARLELRTWDLAGVHLRHANER